MDLVREFGVIVLAYLLGAVPFGFIFVKLRTGKDIRDVQSGRTGGTNAMRAAGWAIGITTGVVDVLKGAAAVWLARALVPGNVWLEILCPLAAIVGHNYSIFLIKRLPDGKLRLGGGAGGATCLGGSFGLWSPSLLIILPLGILIFYFVGYASVTTMSAALLAIVIFGLRAALGLSPWQYILYGVFAELLLLWALRPNIKRLMEGTERLHGYRARKKEPTAQDAAPE